MSFEAWFALAVVGATVALLSLARLSPDLALTGALTVLLVSGVLPPQEALAGFANPGLATVAALYVVVGGLTGTGAIAWISARVLGTPASPPRARLRLMLPVAAISAFLNNTPVVALMVPAVQDWCRRHGLSPSHFMIPLSYAAILGGTCTLVGTSTNLVVHGLVLSQTDLGPMGLFRIGMVGLPVTLVGTLFVALTAGRWLPQRRPPFTGQEGARQYVLELAVPAGSPLVGRTIEAAGLRHLPGAYVAEIGRGDAVLPAVSPSERLQVGDVLLFVGALDSVADLARHKGLTPVPDQLRKIDTPRPERRLVEAVVSHSSPVAGRSIREGRFRSRYAAVVIAVARNGERLQGKIGDIVLRPGDALLLEAGPDFLERYQSSHDFYLLSQLLGWRPPRHERAGLALALLAGMVVMVATGTLSMLQASLAAAAAMILGRCTSPAAAREAIDWPILIVIGASLGLGSALTTTGAAQAIAAAWMGAAGPDPWLALIAVYVLTVILTELITNSAAAVILFPVAQATAAGLEVNLWPFVVVIMMGASASFVTPLGYQTNLMVAGPGGYRYTDFARLGLPLAVLVAVTTLAITPLVWSF